MKKEPINSVSPGQRLCMKNIQTTAKDEAIQARRHRTCTSSDANSVRSFRRSVRGLSVSVGLANAYESPCDQQSADTAKMVTATMTISTALSEIGIYEKPRPPFKWSFTWLF